MRDLRLMTWGPVTCMAALLVVSLAAPATCRDLALPLAVVGAALGIPHGAVDHLVPLWWGPRSTALSVAPVARRAGYRIFLAGYAGLAAAALAALFLAPTVTLLAFLVLSAAHFGRGEVVTSAQRADRPVPGVATDIPVALAHGLVVVGLLAWSDPASTDPYLRALSPLVADVALRSRGPGGVIVAVAVAVVLVLLLRSCRRLEAAELVLLAATFAIAPPVAAFGVYFGAWHSWRHTSRLLDLARGQRVDRGQADPGWGPAMAVLSRAALWPTTVALSGLVVLWLTRDLASLPTEVAVLLGLTFPHAALVWTLDRRQAAASGRR